MLKSMLDCHLRSNKYKIKKEDLKVKKLEENLSLVKLNMLKMLSINQLIV
jgi:hypothetical protein